MTDVKERPILFSAPMVQAIFDGRKVMTRRVVKLRDKDLHDASAYLNGGSAAVALGHGVGGIVEWREQDGQWFGLSGYTTVANIDCPYGQVGDRLWVRETFQPFFADGVDYCDVDWKTGKGYKIGYPATDGIGEFIDLDDNISQACKPSIHMPRWACRIELEVTGVRVERLQDISEADAIAEGIPERGTYPPESDPDDILRRDFQELWESINGRESWTLNPWVWVISFRRVKQ
ncbi:MAG: hypothetical protein ING75_16940 [Rhodocyclaceae bacterium]|nr:hypothetical protein [Rhodocyclaceae bacterium]